MLRLRPLEILQIPDLSSTKIPENIIVEPEVEMVQGPTPACLSNRVMVEDRVVKREGLTTFIRNLTGTIFTVSQTAEGKLVEFSSVIEAVYFMRVSKKLDGACRYDPLSEEEVYRFRKTCTLSLTPKEVMSKPKSGIPRVGTCATGKVKVIIGFVTANIKEEVNDKSSGGVATHLDGISFGFADTVTGVSGRGTEDFAKAITSVFRSSLKDFSAHSVFDTGFLVFEGLLVAKKFLGWVAELGLLEELCASVGYVGVLSSSRCTFWDSLYEESNKKYKVEQADTRERCALLYSTIYRSFGRGCSGSFLRDISVPLTTNVASALMQKFTVLTFLEVMYDTPDSGHPRVVQAGVAFKDGGGGGDRRLKDFQSQMPVGDRLKVSTTESHHVVGADTEEEVLEQLVAFLEDTAKLGHHLILVSYSEYSLFPLLLPPLRKYNLTARFFKAVIGRLDVCDLLRALPDCQSCDFSKETFCRRFYSADEQELARCQSRALFGARFIKRNCEKIPSDWQNNLSSYVKGCEDNFDLCEKLQVTLHLKGVRTLLPGQSERKTFGLPTEWKDLKPENLFLFLPSTSNVTVKVKDASPEEVTLVVSNDTSSSLVLELPLGHIAPSPFASPFPRLSVEAGAACAPRTTDMPFRCIPLLRKEDEEAKGDGGDQEEYARLVDTLTDGGEAERTERRKDNFSPGTVERRIDLVLLSLKVERGRAVTGALYQVSLTDLASSECKTVNVWPNNNYSSNFKTRALGYKSCHRSGKGSTRIRTYTHKATNEAMAVDDSDGGAVLSRILLQGNPKVVVCHDAFATAEAISKLCSNHLSALQKVAGFIELEWCLPLSNRPPNKPSWKKLMSSVLKNEEIPQPLETDVINHYSERFLQKIFEDKRSFLDTVTFLSSYTVGWDQVCSCETNRNVSVLLKIHEEQRLEEEKELVRNAAAELKKGKPQHHAQPKRQQSLTPQQQLQQQQPQEQQQCHQQQQSQEQQQCQPQQQLKQLQRPQTQRPTAQVENRNEEVQVEVEVIRVHEGKSKGKKAKPRLSSPLTRAESQSQASLQAEERWRQRKEEKRRMRQQQREQRNASWGKRQLAVVHLGLSHLADGTSFIDSMDIHLPNTDGGQRHQERAIVPCGDDGRSLPTEVLAAAGYSYRGSNLWTRSDKSQMLYCVTEAEAVDRTAKFLIDNSREGHKYALALLTSDLAEKLVDMFRRHHSSDRWVVLRSLVAAVVDIGNAALASTLGKERLLALRYVPYTSSRLEQVMRLVHGRDFDQEAARDVAENKALTLFRLMLKVDSTNSRLVMIHEF